METAPTSDSPYPLCVGDRVFDRWHVEDPDEDPELAIVIAEIDDSVYEHTFTTREGDELTLADLSRNRRYADFSVSDRVVTIVFSGWLNANVPGWEDHVSSPNQLIEYLAEMEESWRIPLERGSFDYPESRLRLVHRPVQSLQD